MEPRLREAEERIVRLETRMEGLLDIRRDIAGVKSDVAMVRSDLSRLDAIREAQKSAADQLRAASKHMNGNGKKERLMFGGLAMLIAETAYLIVQSAGLSALP